MTRRRINLLQGVILLLRKGVRHVLFLNRQKNLCVVENLKVMVHFR